MVRGNGIELVTWFPFPKCTETFKACVYFLTNLLEHINRLAELH